MPITFTCTCGKTLRVADEYAGKDGECPSCQKAIRIPATEGGQFTEQAPQARSGSEPWASPPPRSTPPPLPTDDDDDSVADLPPLMTHAGGVIAPNDDFFADAPPEIGRLYSCFSTLQHGVEPMNWGIRIAACFMAFVASAFMVGLVVGVLQSRPFRPENLFVLVGLPTLVGLVIVAIILWWTGFSHTCTYVGVKGIAKFTCSGSRENISVEKFFFEDAIELRTGQTRHYYNGVYTGTDYSFAWSDEKGRAVHTLSGRYSSEQGTPVAKDPYHYAIMAEIAWTQHLLSNIDQVTANDGLLFFGLKSGDYIQLGENLLVLVKGGQTHRFSGDKIEKMTMGNGVLSIWEVGAKEGWFVNSGIHQIMYADIGNARFFTMALEKLMGIRF